MKKKYLLILPVIVIIAVLFKLLNNDDKDSQQTDFDKTCYLVEDDDKLLKTIQAISKYGSEGDLKKLSQYIDYPLRRQYPLPVIKDSSDFVKYAGIIWDDSLKNILKTLKPEDWKGYGWEGFSFKDGIYIWTDGDKITGINYYSKKEQALEKRLFEEEKRLLHPSLVKDLEYTWLSFEDVNKELYGRIDVMKNQKYRISIYNKFQDVSDLPIFISMDSIYDIQGSMGNTYLLFSKNAMTVELLHSYYFDCTLDINFKGKTSDFIIDCDYRYNTVSELEKKGYLK